LDDLGDLVRATTDVISEEHVSHRASLARVAAKVETAAKKLPELAAYADTIRKLQ